MFILAFRFRRQCAEQFPHNAYPVDVACTGPAKASRLVCQWRSTRRDRLKCTWRHADPNRLGMSF